MVFASFISTEYAAVNLICHVTKHMESGHMPCNLYIDLSKAFDTLSLDMLLRKLQYYCFTGTELKLLTSYLVNKKRYVKYKKVSDLNR